MPAIRRSSQALFDAAEIALHIAEDNSAAADHWLEVIDEKFRLLAQAPHLGRKRFDLAPELRSLAAGNYVIFYRPIPEGVQIIRVLHGARDIPEIFE